MLVAVGSWIYIYTVSHEYWNGLLGIDPSHMPLISYYVSLLPGQMDLFIVGILLYRYRRVAAPLVITRFAKVWALLVVVVY